MRKKLRLHVLNMPAPVKSKGTGDIGGADDRSTRKRVIAGCYSPQLLFHPISSIQQRRGRPDCSHRIPSG